MHEFSICERLVEVVLGELSRLDPPAQRLCRVRVLVGGLHQIVPDYLVSAYDLLTRDTDAHGSVMEVVTVPVVGRCRRCGWQGDLDVPFFRCGACGSHDIETVGGDELHLDCLEVEFDDDKG